MQFPRQDFNLRARYRHEASRKVQTTSTRHTHKPAHSRPHAHKRSAMDDIKPAPLQKQPPEKISLLGGSVPTPTMPRQKMLNYKKRPIKHYSRPPRAVSEKPKLPKENQDIRREHKLTSYVRDKLRRLYVKIFGDRPLSKPQVVMLGAASVVFLFGVVVGILGLQANSQVEAQATQISQQRSDGDADLRPDETQPSAQDISSYRVAPDLPKRLIIPKIHTNARVKALGTKNDNQLKAPTNIYDIGWYEKSAKPGENGAVLVNGHVHGPKKPGVFTNLKKLSQGDEVSIERGDGEIFTYTVVKAQSYPANAVDMAAALVPAVPGKQGLNIITCNGSLNGNRTGYEERLIVFAVRN